MRTEVSCIIHKIMYLILELIFVLVTIFSPEGALPPQILRVNALLVYVLPLEKFVPKLPPL